jgi:hypothetical protein
MKDFTKHIKDSGKANNQRDLEASSKTREAEKQDALAKALRDNLKKRKNQNRARKTQ